MKTEVGFARLNLNETSADLSNELRKIAVEKFHTSERNDLDQSLDPLADRVIRASRLGTPDPTRIVTPHDRAFRFACETLRRAGAFDDTDLTEAQRWSEGWRFAEARVGDIGGFQGEVFVTPQCPIYPELIQLASLKNSREMATRIQDRIGDALERNVVDSHDVRGISSTVASALRSANLYVMTSKGPRFLQ